MERELWTVLMGSLRGCAAGHRERQRKFSDLVIVATLLWAVLNDRPVGWACRRGNWPFYMRVGVRPTPSTMSRRLRDPSTLSLLRGLEVELRERPAPGVALIIDAKPLPIGGYGRDKDARNGRACGGFAKGYKLYLVIDENRCVHAWRVASMNVAEQYVAEELIPEAARSAGADRWILGDRAYDSNRLHASATVNGLRLVAPRLRPRERMNPGQEPGRYQAAAMLEPPTPLGADLMRRRETVERFLGTLSVTGGGLSPLPGYVRGHARVFRWVWAKLLLSQAARRARKEAALAA